MAKPAPYSIPCLLIKHLHPKPSPYERKMAFSLQQNIVFMVQAIGEESTGVLDLTFADFVVDAKEAQRRWRSLWNNCLRPNCGEVIKVFERQGSGRIHFHLVCDMGMDISHESGERNLKAQRDWLLAQLPRYGFGRPCLNPIETTPEAVSRYNSKTITLGRLACDKGVRLITYLQGARRMTGKWSWHTPGGWVWRHKKKHWAYLHGCLTPEEATVRLGVCWEWENKESIIAVELPPDTRYPDEYHRKLATTPHGIEQLREFLKRIRRREGTRP